MVNFRYDCLATVLLALWSKLSTHDAMTPNAAGDTVWVLPSVAKCTLVPLCFTMVCAR
jgi:hypothetical protein